MVIFGQPYIIIIIIYIITYNNNYLFSLLIRSTFSVFSITQAARRVFSMAGPNKRKKK